MADTRKPRIVVGTMTGTSIDGLDVAIMEVQGRGLGLSARLLQHGTSPLGPLAPDLRKLAEQVPASTGEIARIAHAFGTLHAEAICDTLTSAGLTPEDPELIALHGQTVFHAPPLSWALLDTSPITRRLPCTIVSNLRANDLGAGGQGAPITPLADWILFRSASPRSIVNLGGFCNVTNLPAADDGPEGITGGDVCPCNHLLDAEARNTLGTPFDQDGAHALQGVVDEALACRIQDAIGSDSAQDFERSLGTGDEMTRALAPLGGLARGEDRLATVVDAVARSIAASLKGATDTCFFGGGLRNLALQAALRRHLDHEGIQFKHPSIQPEAREACAMAVLGTIARDGEAITLPAVTGRCDKTTHLDGLWCLASQPDFTDP